MRQPNPDRVRAWRERIDAWKRSGLSVNAFCRERKPTQSNFYRWRRILAPEPTKSKPESASSFIPVQVIPEPMAKVVLPSGIVLRLPLSTTADAGTRLVGAVGAASC